MFKKTAIASDFEHGLEGGRQTTKIPGKHVRMQMNR